jgi:hypothetical protein
VKRRLFNLLAGLSLLLSVGMAICWMRSHYYHDFLYFVAKGHPNCVISSDAPSRLAFAISYGVDSGRRSQWLSWRTIGSDLDPSGSHLGFSGFHYSSGRMSVRSIRFPYWFIVLLFAALPIVWLFDRIRRPAILHGKCPVCGYDLRATPDRCPECGTVSKMVKT